MPPKPAGGKRALGVLLGIVAVLLAVFVVLWFVGPGRVDFVDGGDGVGDPYFPQMGGGGYDAQRYAIDVTWDADAARLTGITTMTARATSDVAAIHVDLALPISQVTQGGQPAKFTQDGKEVRIDLAEPVREGDEFSVTFNYAGAPGEAGLPGFFHTGGEAVIAYEPSSAPLWFPSNDHPSDPALMDVTLRVPPGMEALSVGRLADQRSEGGHDVWHWVASQPMAPYLNFFAIGQYQVEQGEAGGRPYVYAVSLNLPDPDAAMAALQGTPEVIAELEELYGPYPFSEIGGVVPNSDFPFGALENQTRPVYQAAALIGSKRQLLLHETAHMWFGNHVTLLEWNDVFMNEAFASHAEWFADEQAGERPANDYLTAYHDQFPSEYWKVKLSDPGEEDMFSGAIYLRGGMTLQALRNVMGDDAFRAMCEEWGQQPGSRSLEEFRQFAQERTDTDLTEFFVAWVDTPQKPARTAENGF